MDKNLFGLDNGDIKNYDKMKLIKNNKFKSNIYGCNIQIEYTTILLIYDGNKLYYFHDFFDKFYIYKKCIKSNKYIYFTYKYNKTKWIEKNNMIFYWKNNNSINFTNNNNNFRIIYKKNNNKINGLKEKLWMFNKMNLWDLNYKLIIFG